jgi:hypothetical protein
VPPPTPDLTPFYEERLRVPLRWWAVATMFWVSLLLAFLVALPASAAFLFAGVLGALVVSGLVTYGRAVVCIADGTFQAGRARIPVQLLADPRPLDRTRARAVAGVEADARAYLLLRPYVGEAVQVRVVDDADPTPYWLVATRHPGLLAQELSAAIAGSSSGSR